MDELQALTRAHHLFTGASAPTALNSGAPDLLTRSPQPGAGPGSDQYRLALALIGARLRESTETDTAATRLINQARDDQLQAQRLTGAVVAEARNDAGSPADNPVAQREALRRRVERLRRQHRYVTIARARARRRLALLRALRYRRRRRVRRGGQLPAPSSRSDVAVRAALSRVGMPYVWAATGPNQFDCSGLMQWSYRQAGVPLDRTTYDQIHQGIAVPPSQVRPGDLVFPNTGHVQMAIGNGQVVEAPYTGANVRISQLGPAIAIRRPI